MSEVSEDKSALTHEICCECGIDFAMPEQLARFRLDDGGWFYCPNGHAQQYADTLAEQLRQAKADAAYWEKEAARLLTEYDGLRRTTRQPGARFFDRWKKRVTA